MNLQQIEGTTLLRFARKRINIGTFWEHPATISGRVGQSGSLIDTPFFAVPRSRFDTLFCPSACFRALRADKCKCDGTILLRF